MKKTIALAFALQIIGSTGFAATDPLFTKQWALLNQGQVVLKNVSDLERISVKGLPGMDINWVDTKDNKTEKEELIVAVIDSGVDIEHPDLKGRIWYNKICEGAPNAKNLPCNGFNTLENNNLVTDDIGHGTHVAGLIAANINTIGIAGAADPRIKIMPLKVLNSEVSGFVYNGKVITDVIADAMLFAIKNGAEVVNLSLGWPKLVDTAKVRLAFKEAEAKNVIVIAASGNNNKDLPTFPCGYENVVCVGAIDNRGELADFTNHGAKVDIVAPGESIISTYPRNLESRVLRIKNYESKKGSSQAAPYVAAAVANLKLLNPGLTNDQVRKYLYTSSRKLIFKKNDRFAKYGMLDMRALLEAATIKEEEAFINPQLKSLTEVKFKAIDRRFVFNLELKNLSGIDYRGLVCLKAFSSSVRLSQNCINVDLIGAHQTISLPVSGMLLNLASDSHILFQVQIDQHVYQTSLVFSRDLNDDSELISFPLGKASFDDMGVIRGETRASRLSRVFDKYKRINHPEYFYLERLKQTEVATVISLITKDEDKFAVKTINLPKVNRVLSIHRQDINQDGKLDYFLYTLSNKKDELQFYLFDEKLNPLFKKHSTWSMTLSTFEGLPIEGAVEKFEWVSVKHSVFGNILVPSLYRVYEMPEADNSKTISDRVVSAAPQQFYLNPVVSGESVKIELRVIDSAKMMSALRKKLGVLGSFDEKTVYLLRPFPQTEEESRKGIMRSLITLDENGIGSFYEVTLALNGSNFSNIISLTSQKAVDQSLIYPIVSSATGELTKEAVFTSLLNRSSAEFMVKSDNEIKNLLKLDQEWENPIISLTAIFNDGAQKTYMIESRSSMTLMREDGKKATLPIYRDSSFPGQSFSETLMPVLSNGRPGVYINSTLIYGERLYSMIDTQDNGFIRPLNLSIALPNGCVPLAPETLASKTETNYAFLCTDSNKEVALKFLPMSHL
jgi:cell wall-associated protease